MRSARLCNPQGLPVIASKRTQVTQHPLYYGMIQIGDGIVLSPYRNSAVAWSPTGRIRLSTFGKRMRGNRHTRR